MTNLLAYLYTNPSGNRFWYDTRPTLRKTVEDRATQIAASDVEYEIEQRLRLLRKQSPFAGIHICPASSLDVPDEQAVRLVILRPTEVYKATNQNNTALTAVNDILNNRGTAPRIYRNMLAFIAPEQELMISLKETVRRYLAWKSIQEDSDDLNLDAAQNRETDNNLNRFNKTVDDQIKEAYCWLLVPYIDKSMDMKTIIWDTIRISGGNESIIGRAVNKMIQNEQIITDWAPALLLMELDNVLWRNDEHISIKKLWEYICTYCYLPRLANEKVLFETIQKGLGSTDFFAFAAGIDDEKYIGLKLGQGNAITEHSGYLVKVNIAEKQLTEEKAKSNANLLNQQVNPEVMSNIVSDLQDYEIKSVQKTSTKQSENNYIKPEIEPVQNTHFYMSVSLDTTRIGRDVQRLVEEVISHLIAADGAKVDVALEVNAQAPKGLSSQVVRTVSENCQTLHVQDFGFDE